MLVCASHVLLTLHLPPGNVSQLLDKLGDVGVTIFFVLSGFLITTLLCRERERTARVSIRDFYIRRAFRILPAFIAYLFFIEVLAVYGVVHASYRDWLAAITYTMNFRENPAWELGHIWSLSIEEHFYLFWPLLFVCLSTRRAIGLLLVVLIAEPILRLTILLVWPAWSGKTELWTITHVDPIAAGCLLALLARNPVRVRQLDAIGRWWLICLVLLAVAIVAGSHWAKVDAGLTPSVTAISLAILVWSAARRAPRWLSFRPLVVVGIGSYSLYLWQEPFLNPRAAHWWTTFPQNLALAGLAALISYRLVERPFLRIKDRFHPKSKAVHVANSEPATGSSLAGAPSA